MAGCPAFDVNAACSGFICALTVADKFIRSGAAKTALGNDYHALFSFDDALAGRLLASASQENEPFWRLPLAEFHQGLDHYYLFIKALAGSPAR